jgi:hypothetical protein
MGREGVALREFKPGLLKPIPDPLPVVIEEAVVRVCNDLE